MTIIPVILSGGSGTRLWPLSRPACPKQLIDLVGGESLLQQTVRRVRRVASGAAPIVVCNQAHRFQVAEQFREAGVDHASILLEPCGRNTAPAIAVAARHARTLMDEPVLLVLPSDHLLGDIDAFAAAVEAGLPQARSGALITFGVKPTEPATGYGYIRAHSSEAVSAVAQFTEKPEKAVAEQYLQSGDYFWNSGMFMFTAQAYLDALKEFSPDIANASRAAFEGIERDQDFLRIPEAAFAACPSDSIDYAVMEKTSKAKVVPLDAGWSDLGSWQSLWEVDDKNAEGNVLKGDVIAHQTQGCYLRAESRLIGAVGVENLVVVETADAVLVARRDSAQDVKHLVDRLKKQGRSESG